MKKIKTLTYCFAVFLIALTYSCSSEESSSDGAANDIHLSFNTPDWSRKIDCDRLDLYPNYINDSTATVSASSESTRETFCVSYPRDSSKMVKAKLLKKHKIKTTYENNEPFQFSQKLPMDGNSIENLERRLISLEGFSETEYNQIVEIKYLKSEPTYAVFKINCKYEMKAYSISDPEVIKPITGTYAFVIRTTKN